MTFHWRKNCIPREEAVLLCRAKDVISGIRIGAYVNMNGLEYYKILNGYSKEELKDVVQTLSDFVDSL